MERGEDKELDDLFEEQQEQDVDQTTQDVSDEIEPCERITTSKHMIDKNSRVFCAKFPHQLSAIEEPWIEGDVEDPKYAIRWRKDEDGNGVSNSYFIEWSNGSWSLCIGGVLFDSFVYEEKENAFVYVPASAEQDCDSTYMECVGRVTDRCNVKPSSNELYREWLKSKTNVSTAKVKMAITVEDPELKNMRLKKIETEKERQQQKLVKKEKLQQIKELGRPSFETAKDLSETDEDEYSEEPPSEPEEVPQHKRAVTSRKKLISAIFDSDSD